MNVVAESVGLPKNDPGLQEYFDTLVALPYSQQTLELKGTSPFTEFVQHNRLIFRKVYGTLIGLMREAWPGTAISGLSA